MLRTPTLSLNCHSGCTGRSVAVSSSNVKESEAQGRLANCSVKRLAGGGDSKPRGLSPAPGLDRPCFRPAQAREGHHRGRGPATARRRAPSAQAARSRRARALGSSAAHALSVPASRARAAGTRTAACGVRAVTCRAPCWRAGGSGSGRCSFSRSRSLARFPRLPSGPPPRRLRAGVSAREGGRRGGGGRRSGPRRPAEGGGGCEGLREAMDLERLQEALKGGGGRPVSLPPLPSRPSLLSPRAGGSEGRAGPGAAVRCAPRYPSPSRLPRGGSPVGSSRPPALGFVSAAGVGAGGGERASAHGGPPTPVTPLQGRVVGPHPPPGQAPFPVSLRTPGVGSEEKVRCGEGGRAAKQL